MLEKDDALPPGWVRTTLSKISQFLRGVSFRKEDASEQPKDNLVSILRATNIQDEKLILDKDLVYVPVKYVKPEQYIEPGDIVVCMSSGSKNLVGKTAQLGYEWKGSFGTFCAAIRPNSSVNTKFLGYYFSSPDYRAFIRNKSAGININNLKPTDFQALEIPLPPLPEQERIVERIESLFTQLDAGVVGLKRAQAALKRYKASMLKAAFEGKLVPQYLTDEPANDLLRRLEEIPLQGEDLPELPEGWCWTNFDQLLPNGLVNGLYKPSEYLSEKGTRLVDIKGLYKGFDVDFSDCRRLILTSNEIEKYSLQIGDILINRVSKVEEGVGKSVLIRHLEEITVYESNMMLARVNIELFQPYINYFLNSISGRNQILSKAKKTQQSSVNQDDIKSIMIPIPPFHEQQRIVTEVEQHLSVAQEIERTIEANLKRAGRLRQAILKCAFEGKLVSQDLHDVPVPAVSIAPISDKTVTTFKQESLF